MTPEQFFETPTGVMTCEQAHSLAKLAFLAGKVVILAEVMESDEFEPVVIAESAKWKAFYDSQTRNAQVHESMRSAVNSIGGGL